MAIALRPRMAHKQTTPKHRTALMRGLAYITGHVNNNSNNLIMHRHCCGGFHDIARSGSDELEDG
eukprot:610507-Lingulodinium_polyedra.AAC.1